MTPVRTGPSPRGLSFWTLPLLTAALLSIAARPNGSGYVAWVALLPLLYLLCAERNPWRGAATTALAALGLLLVAFEGAAVAEPWTYPVLVATQLPFFALVGLGFVLLRQSLGTRVALAGFPLLWLAAGVLPSLRWLWGDLANPVARLGYSQFDTPLLATAHWSGVSGVELLVLSANVGLFCLLWQKRLIPLLVAAGLAVAAAIVPAATGPSSEPPLRVVAVQGAVRPIDILLGRLDQQAAREVLAPYQALTARAGELTPDLVVWGETIAPQPLTPGEVPAELATALEGADTVLLGGISRASSGTYNSAFLWSDSGLNEIYRKRALVPLVERAYGHGVPLPPVAVSGVRVGVGICLDSAFPGITRDSVLRGAEVLVVLTDDSFAGQTVTPELHLRVSAFRAAETHRPLLFVDQRGPSAFISSSGRVVSRTAPGEAVALVGELQGWTGTTTFVRFGDWVGALAVSALALTLLAWPAAALVSWLAAALAERRLAWRPSKGRRPS